MTRKIISIADIAMNKMKDEGFSSFIVVYDRRGCTCDGKWRADCPDHGSGSRLEILCSETTNPKLLAAMAMDALKELSQPKERSAAAGQVN